MSYSSSVRYLVGCLNNFNKIVSVFGTITRIDCCVESLMSYVTLTFYQIVWLRSGRSLTTPDEKIARAFSQSCCVVDVNWWLRLLCVPHKGARIVRFISSFLAVTSVTVSVHRATFTILRHVTETLFLYWGARSFFVCSGARVCLRPRKSPSLGKHAPLLCGLQRTGF